MSDSNAPQLSTAISTFPTCLVPIVLRVPIRNTASISILSDYRLDSCSNKHDSVRADALLEIKMYFFLNMVPLTCTLNLK